MRKRPDFSHITQSPTFTSTCHMLISQWRPQYLLPLHPTTQRHTPQTPTLISSRTTAPLARSEMARFRPKEMCLEVHLSGLFGRFYSFTNGNFSQIVQVHWLDGQKYMNIDVFCQRAAVAVCQLVARLSPEVGVRPRTMVIPPKREKGLSTAAGCQVPPRVVARLMCVACFTEKRMGMNRIQLYFVWILK